MNLLEQLEHQAREQAEKRKAELRDQESLRSRYLNELDGRTGELIEKVRTLYRHLDTLKRDLAFVYPVVGYGDMIASWVPQLEVHHERRRFDQEFRLRFFVQVQPAQCPVLRIDNETKFRALAEVFTKLHLSAVEQTFKSAEGAPAGGVLRARGKLSVQFQLLADLTHLKLQFHNYEGLGLLQRQIAWEQFSPELEDQLLRFLAREPNALLREELPDDLRKQLKQQIQRESNKRKWEDMVLKTQEAEQAKAADTAKARKTPAIEPPAEGWTARLKSWFGRKPGDR